MKKPDQKLTKTLMFFVLLLTALGACKKSQPAAVTPVSATPTITSIVPTAGAAGDSVVITGTNFSTVTSENAVNFNGIAANVRSATATRLVVVAPTSTTGIVSVKVNNSETVSNPTFTYVLPPTLTGISASSGSTGDVLIITGTNFSTTIGNDVVKINGVVATVTAATATQITVTIPAGATTGAVVVTVFGKAATVGAGVNNTFTVVAAAPNITGMAPTSGHPGDAVTLTGTNFSATSTDNVVLFSGTLGTVTAATATSITVTVPIGAVTGLVTLKVKGIDATVAAPPVGSLAINNFSVLTGTNYGTPGQAYALAGTTQYGTVFKAYDNNGNLWVTDANFQINKISFAGGDPIKTITKTDITFANITSYQCGGLAQDVNGGIHAYLYCSTATGNTAFSVTINNNGSISKDFETTFLEKGSLGYAVTFLSEVLMISNRAGTNDVWRLKSDGTYEIYLKGGTGVDNTLGGAGAYDITCNGSSSTYVLTYTAGAPNTNYAVYKFDSNRNRTTAATLSSAGYLDGALTAAKFSDVRCITVYNGDIYVGDNGNLRIRKIASGTNVVTTVAGNGAVGTTYSGALLNVNIPSTDGLLFDANHNLLYNFSAGKAIQKFVLN